MRSILIFALLFSAAPLAAQPPAVYEAGVEAGFDQTYQAVYKALEDARFYVVFEPDIGRNLAGFKTKWGENHNRNKLERIKSMVFCNAWYANAVSNADPAYLALCPLHVTLTHKHGVSKVLFTRPDFIAKGSKAESIAQELTRDVIAAIDKGVKAAGR